MTTIFWDSQGVIYIDYLEKGKTVTWFYYAELLGQIAEKTAPFDVEKSALPP